MGVLGCGSVGTGVLEVIEANASDIEARLGVPLRVTRIAVSDLDKARDPIVPLALLSDSASELIADPEIDIIVEVIGGQEPAGTLISKALAAGKHIVTANKALLAHRGAELFKAADSAKRDMNFEASVGGGIPIIRTLREGLASERILTLRCIINGTSNYILSEMAEGAAYSDALLSAQELGFAEADPTMDVAGLDAAQKLSILIALCWGADISYTDIITEGLDTVSRIDMAYAEAFGYAIKPLASVRVRDDGLEAFVAPTLVPSSDMLGGVDGAYNAVHIDSKALGPVLLYGQGAGRLPTASAVVSDVVELGRNILQGTHGRLPHLAFHEALAEGRSLLPSSEIHCPYYLRFSVEDEPGVLSKICGALGQRGVSVSRMVQEETETPGIADIVMLTHGSREGDVRGAIGELDQATFMTGPCRVLRVAGSP